MFSENPGQRTVFSNKRNKCSLTPVPAVPVFMLCLFSLLALIGFAGNAGQAAFGQSIAITEIDAYTGRENAVHMPDQLPMSRAAHGDRDISVAWLAGATNRYSHGVLGDDLEASKLVVQLRDGSVLDFELAASRVFEDLQPRLADLDADGNDEIIVVESDVNRGASLAVFGVVGGELSRLAGTPFLGQPHRWLNPVGVGDFDGDGRLDIALVATPHIGGILRLYRYQKPTLEKFAEAYGVSTHSIGSTELELGAVVPGWPRDRLLLPNQTHSELLLIEWTQSELRESARVKLPARLSSSVIPAGDNTWLLQLRDNRFMELKIE